MRFFIFKRLGAFYVVFFVLVKTQTYKITNMIYFS